jgi:dTDP-glucose 4,6-dehydratase
VHLLVTGGAGFIGSNFIHLLASERPSWSLRVLDALTYAGHAANLEPFLRQGSVELQVGDVADPDAVATALDGYDAVVHFAAESHVDRSILGSAAFVRTNMVGTHTLLEAARTAAVPMVLVSTDEVYGDLGPDDPAFTEQHHLRPSSPYSASKAGADLLALSFVRTFGYDVRITRCSNNYGPRQFPEKLIPLMIERIRSGGECPVYGDGKQVRDWIHVDDHNRGVLAVLERGQAGEVYNLGGDCERTNLEVIAAIGAAVGQQPKLRWVEDRPGHDRRYAMNTAKIEAELGWRPQVDFAAGLTETVAWYEANSAWSSSIASGAYQDYLRANYEGR